MTEASGSKGTLTIYDVPVLAGVSIASVSRVLNGQGTPRPETGARDASGRGAQLCSRRVGRALSNGLKRWWGRLPPRREATSRMRTRACSSSDGINRGVEVAAQRRSYDVW